METLTNTLLVLILFLGLVWWIEIGSARRDMMRAHADAYRAMAPRPGGDAELMARTSAGIHAIALERLRQIRAENWTAEHDDSHDAGELASAAACYAVHAACQVHPFDGLGVEDIGHLPWWPWEREAWKPKDPMRNLVRAGALIAAEIDRLQRANNANTRSEAKPAKGGGDA
jgi:hypothetical protein